MDTLDTTIATETARLDAVAALYDQILNACAAVEQIDKIAATMPEVDPDEASVTADDAMRKLKASAQAWLAANGEL